MPVSYSRRHEYAVIPPHPALESMFSDAPVLPTGHRLIRHGIRETIMLRHIGIELKNPMELYYDWCGGTPYHVQVATCRMMVENRRFFNLNHMGTGKTKTALWSWDWLNKKGMVNKLLVVAPLSTLTTVWAGEVFATLQGRKVVVLHGSRQKRLDRLKQDADIYVINHDGLKVIQNELHERADIDCLCLDELAVYRNNSDRSKRMRKFRAAVHLCVGHDRRADADRTHRCVGAVHDHRAEPGAEVLLTCPRHVDDQRRAVHMAAEEQRRGDCLLVDAAGLPVLAGRGGGTATCGLSYRRS
jgi:hypothetical protein